MAWDFDGTDDVIEAALGANYDVPITLACWFNSDTTNSARCLMSLASGSTAENTSPALSLRLSGANQVLATTSSGGGSNSSNTAGTISLTTWHHGAARFASTASRIAYLDGVAGATDTVTRAVGANLDNLLLGQGSGGTYNAATPFNGRIAEAAVWSAALDAAEIEALARGYRPSLIRPDKLLFYLPLVREVQELHFGVTFTNNATAVAAHTRRIA